MRLRRYKQREYLYYIDDASYQTPKTIYRALPALTDAGKTKVWYWQDGGMDKWMNTSSTLENLTPISKEECEVMYGTKL